MPTDLTSNFSHYRTTKVFKCQSFCSTKKCASRIVINYFGELVCSKLCLEKSRNCQTFRVLSSLYYESGCRKSKVDKQQTIFKSWNKISLDHALMTNKTNTPKSV